MKRHQLRILLGAIAVTVAVALIAILTGDRGESQVKNGAGETWNKRGTVGITSSDGRQIDATFTKPTQELATSPLSSALEVIGEPVDIVPRQRTKGMSIVFKVPDRVPLETKDTNGNPQRSIYNAAIEVYEPSMGAWVPLDTRVEGNTLVATAPHFSIFQAVWLKMGKQQIGDITVTTTPAMGPGEMLWRTGLEYLRQFALNAVGRFDESKFDCSKQNEDYSVTLERPNKTDDFNLCVVRKDDASSTVVIKNGWAVPIHLTTDAAQGVTPDARPADIDMVTLIRNKIGGGITKGAYASGLDVGSFSLDHESAPAEFTVKAETSWAGTALDVTLAMLSAIFPTSKLASKAGALADMGNCLAIASQKLATTPGTDVPAKLMEIAKSCMVTFIVDELNLGSMLGAIAKESKIVAELYQLGKIATMKLVTGKDPVETSATVEKAGDFEELQGLWTYECGGSYDLFDVKGREVDWTITAYTGDSGSVETKTYTKGTLFHRGDKTVMIVDETNMTGLKVGMAADLAVLQGRGAPSVDVMFSSSNRYGYIRRGGPSYC